MPIVRRLLRADERADRARDLGQGTSVTRTGEPLNTASSDHACDRALPRRTRAARGAVWAARKSRRSASRGWRPHASEQLVDRWLRLLHREQVDHLPPAPTIDRVATDVRYWHFFVQTASTGRDHVSRGRRRSTYVILFVSSWGSAAGCADVIS
jgi:hypothetical protein